jgi:ComF family protein
LDQLWAIASYQKKSLLSQAIQTLKYKHTEPLAQILGQWMTGHFLEDTSRLFDSADLHGIVPIPLHPSRERSRGYNQARLLAEVLSVRAGLPILEGLQRTRSTPPQAHESKAQRLKNLHQAFWVDPLTPTFLNKKIILIDDVCSTGSTLNEAAHALKIPSRISEIRIVHALA